MSQIGPAVVFPLGAPGNVRGVLTVGRRHGAPPFPRAQVDVVASFAASGHGAGTRREPGRGRTAVAVRGRDRIAHDLHNLVIQRLYATGMSLEGTMPMITRPEVARRGSPTRSTAMDETIKEIRNAIFQLQSRGMWRRARPARGDRWRWSGR